MVEVQWKGGMAFESTNESGVSFMMDSSPEFGGLSKGVSPVEALLGSLAACSAMDVISILEKKRQTVTAYRLEVSGERNPPGEWPRPFLTMHVKHILSGTDIDPDAVARAVELSDEKYCTVAATLRSAPKLSVEWVIES
ncbi:MAG: OsmC family protein [Fimbriimonadaceae bacterium]